VNLVDGSAWIEYFANGPVVHQGRVVPLDSALALAAAQLGVTYKLPLVDSLILATARLHAATISTMNPDFERVEGVRSILRQQR